MLRRNWPFFTLTEILSIHGTFWTLVSLQVKKQVWNIYFWIPLRVGSTRKQILSHGDKFFKKWKIFQCLFTWKILPFLQLKLTEIRIKITRIRCELGKIFKILQSVSWLLKHTLVPTADFNDKVIIFKRLFVKI